MNTKEQDTLHTPFSPLSEAAKSIRSFRRGPLPSLCLYALLPAPLRSLVSSILIVLLCSQEDGLVWMLVPLGKAVKS